jgi:hypothetical protein
MGKMSEKQQKQKEVKERKDSWAAPVDRLKVRDVPSGAVNINVEGRQLTNPLQGFGRLWQKTYTVHLPDVDTTPSEVIKIWKENFPKFHPPQNKFYPSDSGLEPGEIVLLSASLFHLPVDAGLMVLYADAESFTFITPEGFPESGWITFSAYEEDGSVIAQVQSLARGADPIYEGSFWLFGSREQERIWEHVLTQLAARFGVHGQVKVSKICVDSKLQWSQAKNIIKNAGVYTVFYKITAPIRWAGRFIKRKKE